MADKLSLGTLLGYTAFFPNTPASDKSHYAARLGKEFLFRTSSHFLSYFRINAVPETTVLLHDWFTYDEIKANDNPDFKEIIIGYNALLNQFPGTHFKLLAVESFLKLFLWLLDQPSLSIDGEESGPQSCLPFFQFYLLFNDDVLKGFETARNSVKGRNDDKQFIRLPLAISFPQNDFLNIDYAQLLMTQFFKAARLFEFLSANTRFYPVLTKFLSLMRCKSPNDYFSKIGPAVMGSMLNKKPGGTIINVPPGDDFEDGCYFLETLSIAEDYNAEFIENDYLHLRNNPLHRIGKGKYRVIFDCFIVKKVYNGFLFRLSDLVRKEKPLFQGDILGILRDEFSEGTLLYGVLSDIYGNKKDNVNITGKQFKQAGLKVEPDYYLRIKNNIVLFESKDFYMKGEYKISYDFKKIESGLDHDRLGKAVKQLGKNIERIITKTLPLDNSYDINTITVYPVIIVHDALYSAPGLNHYVHYWMDAELTTIQTRLGLKTFRQIKLSPLTIVEIDTLILYQNNLKDDELNFVQLLELFHKHVKYGFRNFKNIEEGYKYANQSLLPFSEFVRDYSYKMNINLNRDHIDTILVKFGMKQ